MKTGMSLDTFDIELDTDCCTPYDNAELTITLRLGFEAINPAGGAAQGTYNDYGDATAPARRIIKWTPGSWDQWKKNFIKSAQTYWHGKFWLANNFSELEFETKSVRYRPNIWCRFVLEGGDADKIVYNHKIAVVRLHKDEPWFGSHSKLYDSKDTNWSEKSMDSAGKPIMQQAHVHEVGHLMGFDHVDVGKAHCPADQNTNAKVCYGVADVDKNSVMGSGMQLRIEHAMPWRKAARQLTGKGLMTKVTDWEAKFARHYPRTPDEVLANAAITRRPKRLL